MAKQKSKKVKEALNKVYLEQVLDWYETSNFVELVGKVGGDTVTYRVYDNGTVTER